MAIKVGIYCGHGRSTDGSWDPGCTYKGYTEAKLMLAITKAFVKYARSSGFKVYTDADENNNINMIKQVSEANRNDVKVFISLHADYYKAPSGTLPLYLTDRGKKLANALNKAVTAQMAMKTRGVSKRTDLYELKQTNMPAVVFETGSIKADLAKLKKADAYGKALARGLCSYFDVKFTVAKPTKPTKSVKKKKVSTSAYAKRIKTYLKAVGLFNGTVNNQITSEYKAAIRKIQNRYFKRAKDKDGIDGPDTLKLAQTLYNFRGIEHFKPEEFRCDCGHCSGYPAVMDRQLLINLDKLRDDYGPISITSGLRCKWKNSRLTGSSSTSRHLRGKAVDMYNARRTSTRSKRNDFINEWYKMKGANYAYGNTPNMGNAVHVDVK